MNLTIQEGVLQALEVHADLAMENEGEPGADRVEALCSLVEKYGLAAVLTDLAEAIGGALDAEVLADEERPRARAAMGHLRGALRSMRGELL